MWVDNEDKTGTGKGKALAMVRFLNPKNLSNQSAASLDYLSSVTTTMINAAELVRKHKGGGEGEENR